MEDVSRRKFLEMVSDRFNLDIEDPYQTIWSMGIDPDDLVEFMYESYGDDQISKGDLISVDRDKSLLEIYSSLFK